MPGQIAAIIQEVRRVINARSSRRAALLKDVEDKLRSLMAAHTEFSRILRSMKSEISDTILVSLRKDEDSVFLSTAKLIERIENIYKQADDAREIRRASRRLLYEEAKSFMGEPQLFSGIIKYVSDEEEVRVNEFLRSIVNYFMSNQSSEYIYYHDLRNVLDRLQMKMKISAYRLNQEKLGDSSNKAVLREEMEISEVIRETLKDITKAENSLDEKWGDVAATYAKARKILISPDDMTLLSNVEDIFLSDPTSGPRRAQSPLQKS